MQTTVAMVCLFPALSALSGQTPQHQTVPRQDVELRVETAPVKNRDRETRLLELFREVGCGQVTEQSVKGSKQDNVLCTVPGETGRIILVGAHYDKVPAGYGVLDNWSGASLLASLYESIAQLPRRHTFVFIGFTAEELGLHGSRAFVRQMSRDAREQVTAMVNLDTLGIGPPKVWKSRGDPELVNRLHALAREMGVDLENVNVESLGSTDSESFRKRGIPSITIHSITPDTLPLIHSARDRLANLDRDAYYQTYRLVASYLAILDSELQP